MRFSAERIPVPRGAREEAVPALPMDTDRIDRADILETEQYERIDMEIYRDDADDDQTTVDPPSVRTGAPIRLPLPADHARPASRMTNPGSLAARTSQRPVASPPPRPPVPRMPSTPPVPQPRRDSALAAATVVREETRTAVASDPMAALSGPLVGGRYRLVKRIGEGGMGKVFKVTHAQLGKIFALKIIHTGADTDEKARESFFREARLASSLSHPNIASVVDFGEDQEYGAFMVMEFLEGEMLSTLLHRSKRLNIKQACDIMLQVAEALHYIHTHRIVHCDIKAENIMLCEVPGTKRRKQEVKLLDFGLARNTAAARQTGSLSGTPHYVAPERIRGEPASPKSDIYGLGILFYELITGQVPWDGNVAQILCGHLEKQPVAPSIQLGDEVDPAVEQLIFKALKKAPEERHKDVAAFLYELRTVMDMLGYGRRKRGSHKRIVVEREPQVSERDQLAKFLFDANRLPLALINAQGQIVVANTAFAKFVMGVAVDVEGLAVPSTPLASAWATFEHDLERACSGEPVRRVIEIDMPDAGTRKLLMWLDPAPLEDHASFGVHPLDQ